MLNLYVNMRYIGKKKFKTQEKCISRPIWSEPQELKLWFLMESEEGRVSEQRQGGESMKAFTGELAIWEDAG